MDNEGIHPMPRHDLLELSRNPIKTMDPHPQPHPRPHLQGLKPIDLRI